MLTEKSYRSNISLHLTCWRDLRGDLLCRPLFCVSMKFSICLGLRIVLYLLFWVGFKRLVVWSCILLNLLFNIFLNLPGLGTDWKNE